MAYLVAQQRVVDLLPFKYPELAKEDAFQPGPNLTVARGTVLGQTAAGIVLPYAAANTDGSQNPIGLARFDFTTDASGNVTLAGGYMGGSAPASNYGLAQGHQQTIPVWISGYFRVAELTGLDAGAVTAFFARQFNLADGTKAIRIP